MERLAVSPVKAMAERSCESEMGMRREGIAEGREDGGVRKRWKGIKTDEEVM